MEQSIENFLCFYLHTVTLQLTINNSNWRKLKRQIQREVVGVCDNQCNTKTLQFSIWYAGMPFGGYSFLIANFTAAPIHNASVN